MAVKRRPRPDSKQYAYDKDNRLTKATEGAISANYAYDSFSRMTGLTAKNGSTSVVSTAVTYVDPSSSATSTQVKTWNNGKAAYTYTYDNKGNITSISDGSKTVTYAYDAFGRLVDVYDPISQQHCVYTYDNGGNLLQKEIYKPKKSSGGSGGGGTIIISPVEPPIELMSATQPDEHGYYLSEQIGYTYGDANWPDLLTAYNGKSITYDAIGNPLSDGTWTYAWQHGRQLASMSASGSSIAYGYNADGKRISKTVNGTTYNYAYLGDTLTDLSWGSNRMHFTYDSLGPASVTYNGVKYFYLKNAQGDVTGLVNASGTQVVSYTYDPWGAPLSVSGTMASTLGAANPLRYRGYVYDSETGLYYLNSRYYNPVWGRFINADGYASTGQGFDGNNMFAYCNGNPLRYRDSSGMLPRNTMTMMTDGGTRDSQYFITLQARCYSFGSNSSSTSGTYVRTTGVTYTTSVYIKDSVIADFPLNVVRCETGRISSTPTFPDAAHILHPFANLDIAGNDTSVRVPFGDTVSYNLYKGGGGISYATSGFNNSGIVYSIKADIKEWRVEWETANVYYDNRGGSKTNYVCVSVDARMVAFAAYAVSVGAGWLLAYAPQLAPIFYQVFMG